MKSTRLSLENILEMGDIFAYEEGGAGGTGDDGGAPGGTGDDTEDESSDDDDGETSSSGKDDSDGLSEEQLRYKLRNRAEQAKRQSEEIKRLKEAKRELDELRGKEEERARKEKPELDNLKSDVEKLTKRNNAQSETIRRLTIENTFLGIPDLEWHDPGDALRLVMDELSEVEVDQETGEIKDRKAVVAAAKDLAKRKGYMVKSKKQEDSPGSAGGGRPTGTPPGNGKKPDLDEAKLRQKYHILR